MAEHPHIELVRKAYRAGSAGDEAALRELYAEDCVLRRPGSHPLAGEHRGIDVMLDNLRRTHEETKQTMHYEAQQLFADGRGRVIAVHRFTADRKGHRRDTAGAALFTIVGDRIASAEVFDQDLEQISRFWT